VPRQRLFSDGMMVLGMLVKRKPAREPG